MQLDELTGLLTCSQFEGAQSAVADSGPLRHPPWPEDVRSTSARHERALGLWVPTTSSRSGDQAIFVDHATDASLPSYLVPPENDRSGSEPWTGFPTRTMPHERYLDRPGVDTTLR